MEFPNPSNCMHTRTRTYFVLKFIGNILTFHRILFANEMMIGWRDAKMAWRVQECVNHKWIAIEWGYPRSKKRNMGKFSECRTPKNTHVRKQKRHFNQMLTHFYVQKCLDHHHRTPPPHHLHTHFPRIAKKQAMSNFLLWLPFCLVNVLLAVISPWKMCCTQHSAALTMPSLYV